VAFRLETELVEPLKAWLQHAGFQVCTEVPILHRRADLLGVRGEDVTAIEVKMHQWDQALRQATAYQLAANQCWVAMPLGSASRAYRERWRFEVEAVGLLAVDDVGRVALRYLPDLLRGCCRSYRRESASRSPFDARVTADRAGQDRDLLAPTGLLSLIPPAILLIPPRLVADSWTVGCLARRTCHGSTSTQR